MRRLSWGLAAATLGMALPLAACASVPEQPTALFLGDSYTAGAALPAQQLDDRWPTRLSQQLGWTEMNEGCDGAGYTRPGVVCMTTYREHVDAVLDSDPDIIVVSGALNDLGSTLGEIEAAVHATFLTLRDAFPDAELYAVGGVYADAGDATATLEEINAIVKAQVERVGGTFVDIGEPLLGRPDLLADDGVHPNSEGHAVIAELTSHVIGEG